MKVSGFLHPDFVPPLPHIHTKKTFFVCVCVCVCVFVCLRSNREKRRSFLRILSSCSSFFFFFFCLFTILMKVHQVAQHSWCVVYLSTLNSV